MKRLTALGLLLALTGLVAACAAPAGGPLARAEAPTRRLTIYYTGFDRGEVDPIKDCT